MDKDRYELWLFEQDMISECNDAAGSENYFQEMTERNVYNAIVEWGEKQGTYKTEDEANSASSDLYDRQRNHYNEILIWDNEERIWFN